jgi:hypothetical protein
MVEGLLQRHPDDVTVFILDEHVFREPHLHGRPAGHVAVQTEQTQPAATLAEGAAQRAAAGARTEADGRRHTEAVATPHEGYGTAGVHDDGDFAGRPQLGLQARDLELLENVTSASNRLGEERPQPVLLL